MKEGLKKLIRDYLKAEYPRIVPKGEVDRKAINEWGYIGDNAGRRCRELETAGVIEVIYNERREAQYRFIPGGVIDIPVVRKIEFGGQGQLAGISLGRAY